MAAISQYAIDRTLQLIRLYANEPVLTEKYDDHELLELLDRVWVEVLAAVRPSQDNPILCRHNIAFSSAVDHYILPPSVATIYRIAELDSLNLPLSQLVPGSFSSWSGPGFRLEGRMIRLDPKWEANTSKTMQILYAPSGDFRMHRGYIDSGNAFNTVNTVVFQEVEKGTMDWRDNAYVGAILRLVDYDTGSSLGNWVEEKLITAWDRENLMATVEPAFSVAPGANFHYEVVPFWGRLLEKVAALMVAIELVSVKGDEKTLALLERQLLKARGSIRNILSGMQGIIGRALNEETLLGEMTGWTPGV